MPEHKKKKQKPLKYCPSYEKIQSSPLCLCSPKIMVNQRPFEKLHLYMYFIPKYMNIHF